MNHKKTKILIVLTASIAISLIFAVPWFLNDMKYKEYLREETLYIEDSQKIISSSVIDDEVGTGEIDEREILRKRVGMKSCLERYRDANHPFALALTACKSEVFYDESNKLPY